MMIEKLLGKIDNAYFGLGGYQDVMPGLYLSFSMGGCGVGTSYCAWDGIWEWPRSLAISPLRWS